MWYAPIGSVEYVRNLHNDQKIKQYLFNENRLKNNTKVKFPKVTDLGDFFQGKSLLLKQSLKNSTFDYFKLPLKDTKTKNLNRKQGDTSKEFTSSNQKIGDNTRSSGGSLGKPISMKTQSAIIVQVYRSYRKTALEVVSYAKNLKSTPSRGDFGKSSKGLRNLKAREFRKKRSSESHS
jgi:hypothetical protein